MDLTHILHDDVGTGLVQGLRLSSTIDADNTTELAGAPRLDPGDRVLHDNGPRRFYPEAVCSLQECVRSRLAHELKAGDVHPIHSRVE